MVKISAAVLLVSAVFLVWLIWWSTATGGPFGPICGGTATTHPDGRVECTQLPPSAP
jgi:uncharacterized membrane protein